MTPTDAATTKSTPGWESRFEPFHLAIVFAAALLIRLCIIYIYPIIFGGDSIVRLYYHDRVLISHQLPVLQAAVHLIMGLTNDPLWVRYFVALAGAVAGVGFYYLCARLLGRGPALAPAVWFAIHPFVVAYSTVPYQEILMLSGLCLPSLSSSTNDGGWRVCGSASRACRDTKPGARLRSWRVPIGCNMTEKQARHSKRWVSLAGLLYFGSPITKGFRPAGLLFLMRA